MSVRAILRFAPVYESRIRDDPSLAREIMVQRGAFTTMKSDGEIPIVVDHDMGRVVGRVTHLRTDEYVGRGKVDWWAAHADISDPPSWLKKQCGVSWDCLPLSEQDVNGTRRVLKGILREISILSPSLKPADPLAQVTWIGQPETPKPPKRSTAAAVATPVRRSVVRSKDTEMDELNRRIEWMVQRGRNPDVEQILMNMKRELYPSLHDLALVR